MSGFPVESKRDRAQVSMTDVNEQVARLRTQLAQTEAAYQRTRARVADLERRLQRMAASPARVVRLRQLLARWLVPDGRVRALLAYVDIRWRLGRGRSLFAADWYLRHNPDVAAAGTNPLWHYLRSGCREGRDPHPLFHNDWYLSKNPDVRGARRNPYHHYLVRGGFENRNPNPVFDSAWYLDRNSDVRQRGLNPLVHFIKAGSGERRDPSGRFSCRSYLADHPDLASEGLCPLAHYLEATFPQPRRDPKTGSVLESRRRASVEQRREPVEPDKWIVVVDGSYPQPDRDAGSIFAIHLMRIFARFGFRVSFVATSEFSLIACPARDAVEAMGVEVIDRRDWESFEEFLRANGQAVGAFFLSRVHAGGYYYESIAAAAPRARIIFNTVDLHGIRERREATLQRDRAGLFRAAATWERELYLARLADAAIVVSQAEVDTLAHHAPGAHVVHVPLIQDFPGRSQPFERRSGIGFLGNFLHPPNADAVEHWLSDIWPLIHRARPDWRFHLIGADMPTSLQRRTDPGLVVEGHVPDLASVFGRLRLTVAPLRYGAGAKGKVITSLGYGVPCVISPAASEGMGLVDGETVLVGRTPEQFAAQTIRLYEDERLWRDISERGHAYLRAEHSFESGVRRVAALFASVGLSIDERASSITAPAEAVHAAVS